MDNDQGSFTRFEPAGLMWLLLALIVHALIFKMDIPQTSSQPPAKLHIQLGSISEKDEEPENKVSSIESKPSTETVSPEPAETKQAILNHENLYEETTELEGDNNQDSLISVGEIKAWARELAEDKGDSESRMRSFSYSYKEDESSGSDFEQRQIHRERKREYLRIQGDSGQAMVRYQVNGKEKCAIKPNYYQPQSDFLPPTLMMPTPCVNARDDEVRFELKQGRK